LNAQVLQDIETEFGELQWFIQSRVDKMLENAWKSFPTQAWSELVAASKPANMQLARKTTASLQRSLSIAAQEAHNALELEQKQQQQRAAETAVATEMKQNVDAIVGMGFSAHEAQRALIAAKNDLDTAVEYLIVGHIPETVADVNASTISPTAVNSGSGQPPNLASTAQHAPSSSGSKVGVWSCATCTLENPDKFDNCEACGKSRGGKTQFELDREFAMKLAEDERQQVHILLIQLLHYMRICLFVTVQPCFENVTEVPHFSDACVLLI
jgi:hypothetical protein